jgi:hypothetical protein
MQRRSLRYGSVAAVAVVIGVTSAQADPASCQKQILNQLFKFEKVYLKAFGKCLDKENLLKIPGPCPDEATTIKIDGVLAKVRAKLSVVCTGADLDALGYSATCDFDPAPGGIKAECSALGADTPEDLADCLACWKRAEANEMLAVLYASHASEVCGGAFDDSSPNCSPLACTTPLPDQRDLGDTAEGTCQRAIGKAGVKHVVKRLKLLEKCARAGGTEATCLADADLAAKLAALGEKLLVKIQGKCGGNTTPVATTSFCCRSGEANACVAAADRDECTTLGGTVQEAKFCDVDLTCANTPGGGKEITWWEICPTSQACGGATLASIDDLAACVGVEAEAVVSEMLCRQIPTGWPCPAGSPSGAFLD